VTVVRVVQIDAGREWRGGQNQVRLLTRALAGRPGIDVRLVTSAAGPLAARARAEGLPLIPVPWTIGLDPRALWGLVREVRRWRPDVLHAHDSHALALALVARRVARRPRPKVLAYRLVDFPIRPGSNWFRADHVAAVSDAVRAVLVAAGLPPDRITTVPPGVDAEELHAAAAPPFGIRERLGLAPGTPLATNVGALVGQKDQLTLIRAAHLARSVRPDLHWTIAGEGERRGLLEAEATRLGVADQLHLLGHVERVPALIGESDVVVLSSVGEGLPNVILEALALGTPVVATRVGGIPEVLPAACLVPPRDPDALARAVTGALAAPPSVPLPERYTAAALGRAFEALYGALAGQLH
jgi:glycosyltransferase involved in cell wall biosynthesis